MKARVLIIIEYLNELLTSWNWKIGRQEYARELYELANLIDELENGLLGLQVMPGIAELKARSQIKIELLKELRYNFKGIECKNYLRILDKWIEDFEIAHESNFST